MIKAIETVYNGYRFRSRLEARWAVFFDKLKVDYQYEPEGFDLNGIPYLPDFHLVPKHPEGLSLWVEIKGAPPGEDAKKKAELLATATNETVVILAGDCYLNSHDTWFIPGRPEPDGEADMLTFWLYLVANSPLSSHEGMWDATDDHVQDKWVRLLSFVPRIGHAYIAARQARFEHGGQ